MAYIIDETYFIRELHIPNINTVDVKPTANPFNFWIETESRLILQDALGFELFKDFDTNIDVNGLFVPGVPKWDNLVNGVEYTFRGVKYKFEGLTFTQGTVKRSLLAYYVFSRWFKFQMEQLTGFGAFTGSSANSKITSGAAREADAWNKFMNLYNGDTNIFQIVSGIDFEPRFQNTHFVSLLKFLDQNKTDYPDAALVVHRSKNRFSI